MPTQTYETLYIAAPDIATEALDAFSKKMKDLVAQHQGALTGEDRWGRRRLAYSIAGYREGFYVLVQFTGGPTVTSELDRLFRTAEGILRHLIVRKEITKRPLLRPSGERPGLAGGPPVASAPVGSAGAPRTHTPAKSPRAEGDRSERGGSST